MLTRLLHTVWWSVADRGHPGLVVGGLDRAGVAESGLVVDAQPHVSASPR